MDSPRNKASNTTKPLVWIIVVNWNGKEDTLACLASLRKVSYQPRHILVIDNASTDGSVEVIQKRFPEVEVLVNPRNERFARANNQGMSKAQAVGAEFVLLLNNDTEVAPDFLEALICGAQVRPDIGMAGPKIFYHHNRQLIWFAGGEIVFWKGRIAHLGLRQRDGERWNIAGAVDYITGCALLVKRECLEKIGGLDESYYIYGEDADWCVRARRAGFQCWFVPTSHVWHKISASSGGGLTAFKAYHKVRSSFVFFKRYARWWHWLTIPWWVALGLLLETFRLVARPNMSGQTVAALWRAFADIFRRKGISQMSGQEEAQLRTGKRPF